MAIHALKTQVQKDFVANVERAASVGIETKTCNAVRQALLTGLNYCGFASGTVALDDKYLNSCEEYLYDVAVEANKQNDIKWAGFE